MIKMQGWIVAVMYRGAVHPQRTARLLKVAFIGDHKLESVSSANVLSPTWGFIGPDFCADQTTETETTRAVNAPSRKFHSA